MPKKKFPIKLCHFSVLHGWYDVEEEMWEFLDLVISMGVIHLPYMKEYWSQEFVCRVPFIGEVFTENTFFIYFRYCIWRLHH